MGFQEIFSSLSNPSRENSRASTAGCAPAASLPNPHVCSFPSRGKKIPTGAKYSLNPLISTLRHSIKKKKKKKSVSVFFFSLSLFSYVMMTKSQRVEMETSHGFEKMRLTVVAELRRMFSNANSEMQSLSKREQRERGGEAGEALLWTPRDGKVVASTENTSSTVAKINNHNFLKKL